MCYYLHFPDGYKKEPCWEKPEVRIKVIHFCSSDSEITYFIGVLQKICTALNIIPRVFSFHYLRFVLLCAILN